MKTIRVVAAVICDSIEHKTKIFSTARGYGKFKGGWEFPGGKIEAGETPQQAVVREIREELDATVKVGDLIDTIEQNNIQCLAEGVETKEELETVISYGVDLIQGYYTAMPSEQVIQKIDPKIVREILEANQIKSDEGGNK